MSYIPEEVRLTPFDERVVGNRVSILDYVSTWGVSAVNYDILEVSGGIATGSNGEIKLSTGTNANGVAEIETKLVGQYQAGTQAEIGWGVRIPTEPVGNQFAEWSYSKQAATAGLGFGIDSTEPYIFYINQGNKTKVYQSDWNRNTLSGSLDFSEGVITQVEFTWYGYGRLNFYVQDKKSDTETLRTFVHSVIVTGSTSINDPNNPIRFDVENGGTASNFDLYVGGHQFSIVGGRDRNKRKRAITQLVDTIELQNTGSWQPLIAVRKKEIFRGQENSINATIRGFDSICSADATFRLTSAPAGTITNGSWVDVDGWGDESAVEVNISTTGNFLQSSGSVFPAKHSFTVGGGFLTPPTPLDEDKRIVLGDNTEGIIYVKLDTPSAGETAKVAADWEEEW